MEVPDRALREKAASLISEGRLRGFPALDKEDPIGRCGAGKKRYAKAELYLCPEEFTPSGCEEMRGIAEKAGFVSVFSGSRCSVLQKAL